MREPRSRRNPPTGPLPVAAPLLRWFREHRRELPWRKERTPYRTWVAEVLLQQTRVGGAMPYFERFVARFPTVRALAAATEEEVLKAWQGAGYYARARHLYASARIVEKEFGGELPRDVRTLSTLPGMGPYLAAAVASIAYGIPVPAVDANALRVAARWTCERGYVDRGAARRRLVERLTRLLPPGSAGEFNEAIMELGETVCLPHRPRCAVCPVETLCCARRSLADPGALPRRRRRPPVPHVVAAVAAIERRGRWLVQRRPPGGLLGGLWEFPGGKVAAGEGTEAACRRELREETGLAAGRLRYLGAVDHAYSHFTVTLHLFRGAARKGARHRPGPERRWVTLRELERLPLPKATVRLIALLRGTARKDRASPD